MMLMAKMLTTPDAYNSRCLQLQMLTTMMLMAKMLTPSDAQNHDAYGEDEHITHRCAPTIY